ncbi:MAG TPA: phage holin family protein [Albitalea sp.]|nr:phage holin family protein [Albitalea sp.]
MPAPAGASLAGLSAASRQLLASLIEVGQTRLELLALEFEEERLCLVQQAIVAACALFFFIIGIGLAAAFLVLWCEPQNRLVALGALSAVFLAGTAACLWRWQRLAAARPRLLQATLAELDKDRRALSAEDTP